MIWGSTTSPRLRDEVLKKLNFFSRNRGLTAFVKASASAQGSGETRRRGKPQRPHTLRGELLLRRKLGGIPRTAGGMPGDSNTDAKRGQIQYDHNKSKQIHSHRQSDCGVHCQNANQPKELGLPDPNENWVTELDQAD